MEIIENLAQWRADYEAGWLAHFEQSGETDWKRYVRPKNKDIPGGPGIDLKENKLMLISSAGAYLKDRQNPFDADNPLGDYSIRLFPANASFEKLAYAHTHYDHSAVNADPQVLLPLRHLEAMQAEGMIGELAESVISYCGYQPDAERTLTETIPAIRAVAKKEKAAAALLVPA